MGKKTLLLFVLLFSINVCGCSIDNVSKELESIVSDENNVTGNWEISEIVYNDRTITPDKLEDFVDLEQIALKISIHDNGTATITNGKGKVIKEPCEWEWADDELVFYSITQYDSEGNIRGPSDDALSLLFDDYAHWKLKDDKLQCRIYSIDLTDSSQTITYERV